MNILVTGGAGYIGSHFAKAAKKAGHHPIVLDNLSTGHKEFVKFGPLVHADLRDTYKVEQALKEHKIEAVVHFAAKALVGESMARPEIYYSNNVQGTVSLLTAMNSAQVQKLVFSSSCAVYGLAKSDTISEGHTKEPINPYGRSKLMCEEIIQDFALPYKLRFACLRYFNVIGEDPEGEVYENHNPETHVIPNLVKALKTAGDFFLYGKDFNTPDGTAIRDYVDVNDLAQVHLQALLQLETREKLISNIGSGRGYSVIEVLKAAERIFGGKIKLTEKERRVGDPPKLVAQPDYFKTWYSGNLRSLEQSLENIKKNDRTFVRSES